MERRSFLKWLTHGLGALWGLVLGIPAVAYLIDARNRPAPAGDFRTVANVNALQKDVPKQVVISDTRRDAWTLYPNDVVGRVWLIKRGDRQVDAFTTICPHLGCSVNYVEQERRFACPCHGGTFHASGERVSEAELGRANAAPRGMDRLECRFDPANPELIQVRYQNFIQGKDTAVPKA
jgi:Rieske Fe-S protein